MGFLDTLIYGYRTILQAGVEVTRRNRINFTTGLSATDDEGTTSTVVAVTAATTGAAGSMSAADKAKLDGIQKQGAPVAIAALNIDWSLGSSFYKTLATGASALTFSNVIDGGTIIVRLTGVGGTTVSWPASVKWPGGVAPTISAPGVDIVTLWAEGADVYGAYNQAMA